MKALRPIVLLNTIDKLIKKAISNRLQFQSILKEFIHPCQLGSLKQCSTTDMDIVLTHIIHTSWIKSLLTSTLAFNITQFFLSLNHQLLLLILAKAEFDSRISSFFSDYLVGRKTTYWWNDFFSPSFNVGVDVGQDSALSPILFALYLFPIFF